jgi:TRAP-type C4-dicarboxylate transport system substrate-binding protein
VTSLSLSALLVSLTVTATAVGEPITLRMAAIAPDGTAWARELKALARDVEAQSGGELRIKWYLGGIAGDELGALERVKRAQLDGEAGAIFCQRLAPSLRAARLLGVYQSRQEAIYVMTRLKPRLDEEFRQAGFANLGEAVFGSDVLFSRAPVRSMAQLRAGRFWVWSLDPIWQTTLPALGVGMLATSLDEAGAVFASERVDGFFAVPSAALAYQWSTQARYFSNLGAAVLPGCIVVANVAYDPLSNEQKQALTAASAKFVQRFNAMSAQLDDQLVTTLFAKQGLTEVPVSPQFRAEFAAAAQAAAQKLGDRLLPAPLYAEVTRMLDEFRAQRILLKDVRVKEPR